MLDEYSTVGGVEAISWGLLVGGRLAGNTINEN